MWCNYGTYMNVICDETDCIAVHFDQATPVKEMFNPRGL